MLTSLVPVQHLHLKLYTPRRPPAQRNQDAIEVA